MTSAQPDSQPPADSGDVIDEPIDLGDRFRWADHVEASGEVQPVSMFITEDGVVQVRVSDEADGGERTVTATDLIERVAAGDLVRIDE
jgi:hypothetical protein